MNKMQTFEENCGNDVPFIATLSWLITTLCIGLILNLPSQIYNNIDVFISLFCVFGYTYGICKYYYIIKWAEK